ncbi:hypothetical protein [Paenibacillus montanisoli]|uniref:hypothetical protein n=1 Tax=Paenibacillus montanisoli TaxID=2081970 RepID=UPI0014030B90|nr:hypothetical protein [Paenibacillus montanisoli]
MSEKERHLYEFQEASCKSNAFACGGKPIELIGTFGEIKAETAAAIAGCSL